MVEFADKTVHNMGGGMDAKSGRVMLPGRHWAKFGELVMLAITRVLRCVERSSYAPILLRRSLSA